MSPAAFDPTAHAVTHIAVAALMQEVGAAALRAGVFGAVKAEPQRVEATASASASPACYRLELLEGVLWVSLVMQDRWQSHSIEADLLNTGDKIEDLIAEEVGEHGFDGDARTPCEHFRSEDKLFTFRSRVPVQLKSAHAPAVAAQWLLGYEACFRRLGDMEAKAKE